VEKVFKMPRKKAAQTICPRCGLPVSYFEKHRSGDKEYLYAVHYYGYSRTASGKVKKKVRKCYLGPVGAYEYVTKLHFREGLVLRGLSDSDRAFAYLEALIRYVRSVNLPKNVKLKLAARFREIAEELEAAS